MEFLSHYSWIISLIGLFVQFLILCFCQKRNVFKDLSDSLSSLFKNDNLSSFLDRFVSQKDSEESVKLLKELLEYLRGDKNGGSD